VISIDWKAGGQELTFAKEVEACPYQLASPRFNAVPTESTVITGGLSTVALAAYSAVTAGTRYQAENDMGTSQAT